MDIAIVRSDGDTIGVLTGKLEELTLLADRLFGVYPKVEVTYLLGREAQYHPASDIANRIRGL